jgi:hypothetical protein
MKLLLTDFDNFKLSDTDIYDEIKIVTYHDDNFDFFDKFKEFKNVEVVYIVEYFKDIYLKASDEIGLIKSMEEIGLYKLLRSVVFDINFIKILILESKGQNIYCKLKYNELLQHVVTSVVYINTIKSKIFYVKYKYFSVIKYLYMLARLHKSLLASMFSRKGSKYFDIVCIDYEKNKHTKFMDELYPNSIKRFFHNSRIHGKINLAEYLNIIKMQNKIIKLTINNPLYFKALYIQMYAMIKYSKIISNYNPKLIFGTLDGPYGSEFLFLLTRDKNIKTICYPHTGVLEDFRIEIRCIPFDYYLCWSRAQKEQAIKHSYCKKAKYIVIGNPYFTKSNIAKKQENNILGYEYDIIFPLDYYQQYHINPVNPIVIKKIARDIKELSKKYKILIRARMSDKLFEDVESILEESVSYSIPSSGNTAFSTIVDDLNKSNLVLIHYTGALNEAILLDKPIVHFTYFNFESTHSWAVKNNIVYFANSKECLIELVDNFFINKLEKKNYTDYVSNMLNNFEFDSKKIKKVIDKIIRIRK